MRARARLAPIVVALILLVMAASAAAARAAPVGLGTAASFSVLGGSTVTNTGPSVLDGDLGVSPGSAITGFPPGSVGGAVHAGDAVAQQAQSDLVTAYDDAATRSSTATVSGDLAGSTLGPGVYSSGSSLGLTGDLTLDAGGDPNAVFVFQAGSTLTTGSGSRVLLTGGAQACNVFWQVGSSATIGTSTTFVGNILALTSISLTTGATVDGRALARNGAVTLDTNTLTRSACTTPTGPAGGPGSAPGGGGTTGPGGSSGGGTTTVGSGSGTTAAGGSSSGGGSVVTPGLPLTVSTGPVSHVGPGQAVVSGTVRPGDSGATYLFQFGPTRHYGRHTPSGQLPPGTTRRPVHGTPRRLRRCTTYHYRVVGIAPNSRRIYGIDRRFRTTGCVTRHPARRPRTPRGFTG